LELRRRNGAWHVDVEALARVPVVLLDDDSAVGSDAAREDERDVRDGAPISDARTESAAPLLK
jgi:hypothetical protein